MFLMLLLSSMVKLPITTGRLGNEKPGSYFGLVKGAMSHNTHARANENKLEKDGPTFSSCVGDFGRLFLSV